jgi:DNA polymerase-3 subunit chi
MSDSCQVDFYVLTNPTQTAGQLACRLALMAWEQGNRITVLTENTAEVEQLDALMWNYPAGRFLPHSTGVSDADSPIRIAPSNDDIPADCDVVINLSGSAISKPERFKRLLEIVPGNEADRVASRQKFRSYRKLGLSLASHTIGK